MSRYLERAETTTRFVNVHNQMLLESSGLGETGHQALWDSLIAGLGDTKAFEEAEMEGVPDALRAPFFMSFSRENPSSILSSLYACRENARMVRDQISSEMWEAINDLYLEVRSADGVQILSGDSARFFQEVIDGYHLFRGVTDTSFPRRRGYEFLKVGAYLERADKTSRFLGTGLVGGRAPEEERRDLRLVATLRSCCALESYHRIFVTSVDEPHMTTFLLQDTDLPRSVLFSLFRVRAGLHKISGTPSSEFSNEAERICGKLISDVLYADSSKIDQDELLDLLARVQTGLGEIAEALSEFYMFNPIIDDAVTETELEALVAKSSDSGQKQSQSSS